VVTPAGNGNPPERFISDAMREQLELRALPTFGMRPFLADTDDLDSWQPDVAVMGAPFDLAVTNRPGARFGPRAVRSTSYEPGTYHLGFGIEIFDWLEVVDVGDAWCPHGQPERGHANIKARVHEIARRDIIPIVIGGDHSITWPVATAVADHLGYGRLGMVHFDAHADTADTIEGNLASHGTPMRRLIESGAVRGRNFIQVGLRGYWPGEEVFDWMAEQGMRWHLMDEIWERGMQAVVTDAIAEALDGCDALYLSVDIDSLDPAHAPGTGTPEPGGLTSADLLQAIRQIVLAAPVVAMDVCEVAPAYDHADLTVNAAHRCIYEALAAMAHKRRLAAGGAPGRPSRQ
jgi:agmatinase